jgi:hypothetical protein
MSRNLNFQEAEVAKKPTAKKQIAKETPMEMAAAAGAKLLKLPMWTYVLLGVVIIAVGLINYVSGQPDHFEIERHIVIDAPAAKIIPQISDFHHWGNWLPWKQLDPTMKETFEGSPAGLGSIYRWNGNSKVGEGSLTITDFGRNGNVTVLSVFKRPFIGTDAMTFLFAPQGKGMSVQWVMTGNYGFADKFSHLFGNPEKKLGDDFQNGLEQLKAVVQPGYQPPSVVEKPQLTASI